MFGMYVYLALFWHYLFEKLNNLIIISINNILLLIEKLIIQYYGDRGKNSLTTSDSLK